LGIKTDITKQEELQNLFDRTIEHFGTVDILINNVGILDNFMTVGDLDIHLWQKVMDVNVGVSYVTSKHAIIGLTKNIASVYRDDHIRAVAVAPGSINTNIGNTLKQPNQKGMEALTHYGADGPIGDPIDVANVIVFLASDEAKFVNGTVVTVDGGWRGA
jgi:NAD(P)-dependent dehydrogenase (short-subunit alcohol dehydrogenase family)